MEMVRKCAEFRCQSPSEVPWSVAAVAWGTGEQVGVCEFHFNLLSEKVPYQIKDGQVLMGDDLGGGHERLVVGDRVVIEQSINDATSSDPEHRIHMQLEVRRRGGVDVDPLDLVLTEQVARNLIRMLNGTVKPPEIAGD